jgi:hypothetical protein
MSRGGIMIDVKAYCDSSYKRLVGLKAGLYDIMTKTEAVNDSTHIEALNQLKKLFQVIQEGIDQLRNECPSDWSPNKKDLDNKMEELLTTLGNLAEKHRVNLPDTTAWI